LIHFGNHPVVKNYLVNVNDEPSSWPIHLYFCESCGLTQLVDSCPPEVLYENYVTLSDWKNQPHVQHEIDFIKNLPGISADAKIIEIGSNDGVFLKKLLENGFRDTLGIEPTRDAYDASIAKGLNTIQAFLNPDLAKKVVAERGKFDLFLSRQNLEHISDLKGIIESINVLIKPGGYVVIEVPNHECNLQGFDYALWEEHVNYFTVDTLRYLLSQAEVEIIHEENILFSGEALLVVGKKVGNVTCSVNYLPELRKQNVTYAEQWPKFRQAIRDFLFAKKSIGRKIAVYGAGVRTLCWINFTGIAAYIDIIVDDQVEKQNKFMPGGKIPILPSSALYQKGIDIVLLAVNTENEEKVINKHKNWVSNGGQFWSILPPSDRLLPVWKLFCK